MRSSCVAENITDEAGYQAFDMAKARAEQGRADRQGRRDGPPLPGRPQLLPWSREGHDRRPWTSAERTSLRCSARQPEARWRVTEARSPVASGGGQRPAQPLTHAAAHHPVEVVTREPGQLPGEQVDALAIAARHPREVGAPEHPPGAERIEER